MATKRLCPQCGRRVTMKTWYAGGHQKVQCPSCLWHGLLSTVFAAQAAHAAGLFVAKRPYTGTSKS